MILIDKLNIITLVDQNLLVHMLISHFIINYQNAIINVKNAKLGEFHFQ